MGDSASRVPLYADGAAGGEFRRYRERLEGSRRGVAACADAPAGSLPCSAPPLRLSYRSLCADRRYARLQQRQDSTNDSGHRTRRQPPRRPVSTGRLAASFRSCSVATSSRSSTASTSASQAADGSGSQVQRRDLRPGRRHLLHRLLPLRGAEQPDPGARRRARVDRAHHDPVGHHLRGVHVRRCDRRAFTASTPTFYVLRFLLGVAEAGFFPGIILYLTYWFPSAYRSRMTRPSCLRCP